MTVLKKQPWPPCDIQFLEWPQFHHVEVWTTRDWTRSFRSNTRVSCTGALMKAAYDFFNLSLMDKSLTSSRTVMKGYHMEKWWNFNLQTFNRKYTPRRINMEPKKWGFVDVYISFSKQSGPVFGGFVGSLWPHCDVEGLPWSTAFSRYKVLVMFAHA